LRILSKRLEQGYTSKFHLYEGYNRARRPIYLYIQDYYATAKRGGKARRIADRIEETGRILSKGDVET
jgi:hypothetical protein